MNKVNKFQRDEVIKIIYKAAQKNKKIFFLSGLLLRLMIIDQISKSKDI